MATDRPLAFTALLYRSIHIIRSAARALLDSLFSNAHVQLGGRLSRSSIRRSHPGCRCWSDFYIRSSKGLEVDALDFRRARSPIRHLQLDRTGKLVDVLATARSASILGCGIGRFSWWVSLCRHTLGDYIRL